MRPLGKGPAWRPLVFLAFGVGAGLSPWIEGGAALGAFAVLAACLATWKRAVAWGLPILVLAAGLAYGNLRLRVQETDSLENVVAASNGPLFCWVRGTVSESEPWQEGCRVRLSASSFKVREEWVPCGCDVRAYLPVQAPQDGSSIEVSLRLTRPAPSTNPGQFDMAAYLARKGMRLTGTSRSEALVEVSPPKGLALLSLYRLKLERRLLEDTGEGKGAILALLLGERGLMNDEETDVLAHSGLYHLVALSGLHVGLMLFLLAGLAHACNWSPVVRDSTGLFLIAAYGLLVAERPSLNRALAMGALFLVARLMARPQSGGLAWCASFALLLAIQPLDLQDTGFQLTFAATLGILALWGTYPSFLPQGGFWGSLLRLLWVGLTAQLATLPFVVLDFHRLSLLGWLVTPLASLPVMAIQAIGVPYILGLAFVPGLHHILGWLLDVLGHVFLLLPELLGRSRYGNAFLPIPWAGWFVIYAGALGLLCLAGRSRKIGAVLAAFTVVAAWNCPRPDVRKIPPALAVLNVGQASCQVLMCEGRTLLIDAGNGAPEGPSSGRSVIEPFLASVGVRSLDGILLTHWDSDHSGSAEDLMKDFRTGFLAYPATDPPPPGAASRAVALALERGTRLLPLSRGDGLRLGPLDFRALNPAQPPTQLDPNDRCLVLGLRWPGPRVLFSGDLQKSGEGELSLLGLLEPAYACVVPHHGSRSSSTLAWVQRVRPRVALFSVGWGNRFGFPSEEVVQRYRDSGARVLRTDLDGGILLAMDGKARIFTMKNGDWLGVLTRDE